MALQQQPQQQQRHPPLASPPGPTPHQQHGSSSTSTTTATTTSTRPPPAYSSLSNTDHQKLSLLQLPSVPRDDLPATLPYHHPASSSTISLPDLKSLGLPTTTTTTTTTSTTTSPSATTALNTSTSGDAHWFPFQFPRVPDTDPDALSPSLSESVMSLEDATGAQSAWGSGSISAGTTSVSVDDPDVRMAAEALSGLGKLDFLRSAPERPSVQPPKRSSIDTTSTQAPPAPAQEPEPLLQLLTSSHPWVGGTINGSLSAYNATKNYSPRFVRNSAEFVERTIGTPVAYTVGNMTRRTGVEGSIRRYLGGRRRSDMEEESNQHKKRRIMGGANSPDQMDVEKAIAPPLATSPPQQHRSRAQSQASSLVESLPAYEDNQLPQYEEHASASTKQDQRSPTSTTPTTQEQPAASRSHAWGTQLMITTSGLGVALSEGSLRSLRYCLQLLHNATARVGSIMRALKLLIEDYERSYSQKQQQEQDQKQSSEDTKESSTSSSNNNNSTTTNNSQQSQHDIEARRMADAIKAHSTEIWETLRTVINNISQYTGGALPENAGALVRRQLMSVPQRWRAASASSAALSSAEQGEAVANANRMLAFAKEGLDMMAQVALVLEGTVTSAEAWLTSMGGKRKDSASDAAVDPNASSGPTATSSGPSPTPAVAAPGNRTLIGDWKIPFNADPMNVDEKPNN